MQAAAPKAFGGLRHSRAPKAGIISRTRQYFPIIGFTLNKTRVFIGFFVMALSLLSSGGQLCMIEALFNQPNYLAAKKTLDAVVLRQEAIANNIANLETPGYKRVDLAPSFESQLQQACASGDSSEMDSLKPTLAVDNTATASSLDGNTVHLQNELMEMNQNAVAHSFETQLVSGMLQRMQMAISGKD